MKRNGRSFEDCEQTMDKIRTFFSSYFIYLWILIDFNGMNICDFLVSLDTHAYVLLLYMFCILGLFFLLKFLFTEKNSL